MRAGSSYVATAVALGIMTLTGCTTNDRSTHDDGAPAPGEDWGDENKYPEIGGAFHNLDALTGTCTFANGVVTVTSTAAQTIVIGKRAVDSVILVNGADCKTVATATVPATAANSTTMKRLVVTGSSNDESLILDFLGGFFAPGVATASAGSIAIDLAGGTDAVNIRATSAADTLFLGSDGLAFNADNYKDITFAGAESLNIALAGGADALTATNATATKGVTGASALPLTVFGGAGNDVIVGGAGVDSVYGGPGNDTLSGGAGADFLYGDDGADIMQGTAAADGNDTINCGDEASNTSVDVVSYDRRTNAITATMGTLVVGADGGGGADAGADGGVAIVYGTAGEGSESDQIAMNCEGVTGGAGNDTITGNEDNNTLSGGAGNDTITGGDGDDTLNGGDGDDTFSEGSAENGGDVFNGGAGTDTVDYSSRTGDLTATMDGSAANDGLDGEEDNIKADVENILCGSGADDITGNTLANKITGGTGADTLSGGGGDDTFLEGSVTSGGDIFNGGAGTDTVDYSSRTGALTVTMGDDTANDGLASETDNVKDDVENLLGGDGNDNITGNDADNLIEGGDGDDTIDGGDGDDRLDGSDTGVSVDNDITCGAGTDLALNKGGAGSYASDCELKGN